MTRVNIKSGHRLKTGDTEPDLVVKLIKDNGNPKDLSSGSPEVSLFIGQEQEDTLTVDDDTTGNVTISDPANGEVTYSWESSDTSTAGSYIAEFEVDETGNISTYPNRDHFDIFIEEGLN